LSELLDYLVILPPAESLPTFHIVLRYDPEIYLGQIGRLMLRLRAILRTPHLSEKVRFHSDTAQLANAFSSLFNVAVSVCPIPVDLDRLLAVSKDGVACSTRLPLIASYLGTARSEKGYRDLIGAIAFLKEDYILTDRLHLVLQCSESSILSEPGLMDYQRDLEKYLIENGLRQKVRLVKHIVGHDEYCNMIAQSDIVILAYSPFSYRYRSSGVLMESMATGKVVVTRAGSWIASQVGLDNAIIFREPYELGAALARAVEDFNQLITGAKKRQLLAVSSGNPATLATHFLQSRASVEDIPRGPVIMMIADGGQIARGDARGAAFLQCLACCSYSGGRVLLLLINTPKTIDFDVRRRLADALRGYALVALSAISTPYTMGKHFGSYKPDGIYLIEEIDPIIVDQIGLTGTPLLFERAVLQAFPFQRPARIEELAGCIDGFELIAISDPTRVGLSIDTKPFSLTPVRYDRLKSINSIDVLLHATTPEVSRRFLDDVYMPFLAGFGITVLAVGDVDGGPDVGNFLFIGPVTNRDPLYAAAKVVVACSPIAAFEALGAGKPTLLFHVSTTALSAEGFESYIDAQALADAIQHLLGSKDRRLKAASHSLQSSRRLASKETIISGFSSLGVVGLSFPIEHKYSLAENDLAEWGQKIQAANRLVRSFLANYPLDNLADLVASDEAIVIITRMARALIDEAESPLLNFDSDLLLRCMRLRELDGAAGIVRLVKNVMEIAGAEIDCSPRCAFINRKFPTKIVISKDGNETYAPLLTSGGSFERQKSRPDEIAWRLRAEADDGPDLVSVNLSDGKKITIIQEIPIASEVEVLGRSVFNGWVSADDSLLVQRTLTAKAAFSKLLLRISLRIQLFLAGWSPLARPHELFDPDWYVMAYPESADSRIEPYRHFARYGAVRGYKPNPFFDPHWYADRYELGVAHAWPHYLRFGYDSGLDPGPYFSAARYMKDNPDLLEVWKWSPLLHYLYLGRSEGRKIHPAEPLRPSQSLALPVVIGGGGNVFVEITLDHPPTSTPLVDFQVGGRRLSLTTSRAEGGELILSALLPCEVTSTGLVLVQLSLALGECPVEILELRTRWTSSA
jgi:hypothetical protein